MRLARWEPSDEGLILVDEETGEPIPIPPHPPGAHDSFDVSEPDYERILRQYLRYGLRAWEQMTLEDRAVFQRLRDEETEKRRQEPLDFVVRHTS